MNLLRVHRSRHVDGGILCSYIGRMRSRRGNAMHMVSFAVSISCAAGPWLYGAYDLHHGIYLFNYKYYVTSCIEVVERAEKRERTMSIIILRCRAQPMCNT